LFEQVAKRYRVIAQRVRQWDVLSKMKEQAQLIREKVSTDEIEKNRFLVLVISIIFIFDYLVFCYHTEKSPFDIFPAIPVLDDSREVTVYVPALDGKSILKETRRISVFNKEGFVRVLFQMVMKGSYYENTSAMVPVKINIRKIWFYDDACIIDVMLVSLDTAARIIPGSEKVFRESLEKTITENISSIKRVVLLERGIPFKDIWEMASSL
jgi:hypothetical protein